MTKICNSCTKEKEKIEFYKRKLSGDGLQAICKTCTSLYNTKYYDDNRDKEKKRSRLAKIPLIKRNRKYISEYLSSHPCVDCGEVDSIVLQFDHVRKTKKYDVSGMLVSSLETLQIEIDKCDIRCANCHVRRTAKQFNWSRLERNLNV